MKVKSKKTKKILYHHDNLKESLIKEALRFLKNGRAEDLSLRELSRRTGVSHMAPYRHFGSKEDLLAEIIQKGFKTLTAMFDQTRVSSPNVSFQTIFSLFGKAYIQFVVENPDQARLMFSGLLCDPKRHASAHQAGQEAFGRLIQLIQLGQEKGHIQKDDNPYLLGLMIWASVHGSAMLIIENQFGMIDSAPKVQVEKYVEFMSERILRGLK